MVKRMKSHWKSDNWKQYRKGLKGYKNNLKWRSPTREIRRHCVCMGNFNDIIVIRTSDRFLCRTKSWGWTEAWGRRCADYLECVSWNIADTQTSAWRSPLRLVASSKWLPCGKSVQYRHTYNNFIFVAPIQNDGVLVLASRIERTGRCTIELRQLLIRAWLICGGRLIRTRQRSKSHPGPPSLQHNVHTGENAGPGLNFQQSPAVRKLSCPEDFFSGQLVFTGNPHHWKGACRKST